MGLIITAMRAVACLQPWVKLLCSSLSTLQSSWRSSCSASYCRQDRGVLSSFSMWSKFLKFPGLI